MAKKVMEPGVKGLRRCAAALEFHLREALILWFGSGHHETDKKKMAMA